MNILHALRDELQTQFNDCVVTVIDGLYIEMKHNDELRLCDISINNTRLIIREYDWIVGGGHPMNCFKPYEWSRTTLDEAITTMTKFGIEGGALFELNEPTSVDRIIEYITIIMHRVRNMD